ncbi:MAG: MerR family transcriptional regulator [Mariniblastus sp.]
MSESIFLQSPQMQAESITSKESPIANQRIAFVGKLGGMNRKEARDVVKQHGGMVSEKVDASVNIVVIGADVLPLDEQTDLLDDWVLQASADGTLSVVNESKFWQDLGMVETELDIEQLYTPAMLAQLLDIPIATIRRWHRRGLITPTRQFKKLAYFDFQEVASARRIAKMIASGATPKSIETKLSRLAGLYPNLQRPLSQLSVIVEGKVVLLRQGEGLVEPGGQRRIDFDLIESETNAPVDLESPSELISLDQPIEIERQPLHELATPNEFIKMAIEFEDDDDSHSAIEVYRTMSLAFGPSADVCFRIAELLYQQNDLAGARERYYLAVELDESFVEARASLGCVLFELDEKELALAAFYGALEHHPDYPDVHFHLARLLDELDRAHDAEPHWRTFLELAPKSPWAEEARERLSE